MECRDTQISCVAARSLAKPPEACRPQEGIKSKAPKHPEVLGRAIRRAPIGRPPFPTQNPREVFRAGEGDDGAESRSSDLTNATTDPEEGLTT
jgi:hypothetical protein